MDIFERLEITANLSLILLTAAAGLLVSVEARVGRPRGVGSAGAAGVDRGSSWNLGAITIVNNFTQRGIRLPGSCRMGKSEHIVAILPSKSGVCGRGRLQEEKMATS